MTTTQEMLEAGIAREQWVRLISKAAQVVVALDAAAHDRGDDDLVAVCHAFMDGANAVMQRIDAENLQAFQAFQIALAETDELEQMLAAGGEEVAWTEADEIALDRRTEARLDALDALEPEPEEETGETFTQDGLS